METILIIIFNFYLFDKKNPNLIKIRSLNNSSCLICHSIKIYETLSGVTSRWPLQLFQSNCHTANFKVLWLGESNYFGLYASSEPTFRVYKKCIMQKYILELNRIMVHVVPWRKTKIPWFKQWM